MRFYSQKVGGKFKKVIFKALESKVWRFNDVKNNETVGSCVSRHVISHTNTRDLFGIKFSIISAVFIFAVLVISYEVESNTSVTRKIDTMNMLPAAVSGENWDNQTHALTQDIDDSGIYQSFSKTNSASFIIEKDRTNTNTNTEAGTAESVPTTDVLPAESDTTNSDPDTTSDPAPLIDDQSNLPTNSDAVDNVPTDEPSPTENETPLEAMSRGFLRFTTVASALLPLAQESITTSPVTDALSDVTEEPVVPITHTENDQPVLNAAIENGVVSGDDTDTSELVGSDTPVVAETGEAVAQDGAQSIEYDEEVFRANEIVFSDFGLPPLESGQFIKNMQLRMSLAGSVECP
jgi:hypothetical protein